MQKRCNFKHYIRPGLLIISFLLFFIAMFFDNTFFHIKDAYIKVMETILTTMVAFYFGSRGIEKVFGKADEPGGALDNTPPREKENW